MDEAVGEWVGQQIGKWRVEAEQTRKPDLEALQRVVSEIAESGVPEGLVVYVVLGCEWLFRARKVTDADVAEIVGRLRERLSNSLQDQSLGYLVTDALRASIGKLVRREGRVAPAYGLFLPTAPPLFRGLFSEYYKGEEEYRPERIAPVRQGAPPWPAPWVAAIVVKRLLKTSGVGSLPLALNLVGALLGRHRRATKIDLRNREANLGDDLLVNLARDFGDFYLRLFQGPVRVDSGQGSRAPDPERDWPVVLEAHLRLFGPRPTFPGTSQLVQGVLVAGARSRKAH